jgi:AraC-like DNA-binding protein
LAGISEVRCGFDWAGPAATHLVLGTIEGAGFLKVQGGTRSRLEPGDLILAPAGLARRYAASAARWKFLAIRLADDARRRAIRDGSVRRLPGHWLRRLIAPVEGMLAEHPLGDAVFADTEMSRAGGESPLEYLLSRYADRIGRRDGDPDRLLPRPDAFELHATILSGQIEEMLSECARPESFAPGDEGVALASLWARVRERPRGPWGSEDLASSIGVSRTTLYRMVKRRHRTSPAKVVESLRMEEASRLLTESRHSIDVIADQVGYASAFSFSAAFKRVMGTPPSFFRRAGG